MRLFVALVLPDDVVEMLDAAVASLRRRHPDLNWTPPATWHVTLAFLGSVPDERADEVAATVAGTAEGRGPIGLRLGAPGRFGRTVAWVGVEDQPAGEVALLGAALQRDLAGAGLPVERRPVHPHVTLARARGRRGVLPAHLVDDVPRVDVGWVADAVSVQRSHLGDGPVRHEERSRVSLAGAR